MEDGGQQCRGEDLTLTYVLRPCQRTRLSLILKETSRGDKGIVLSGRRLTGRNRGLRRHRSKG